MFTNTITFKKAIEEIQFLEREGISITIGNETKQIYIVMTLFLGDNLGLPSILGFIESFSANFSCRFCLIERNNFYTVFNERNCVLRNAKNYETLAAEKNVSVSAIKETCIFNQVDSFHVTDNLIVDPQHDLLEGILRYDIALILNNLIYVEKLFSLDDLNFRFTNFQYGADDNINKPPPISVQHIKKGYLITSSAEMLNLIRSLFLIVGPFVPEENIYWQLLIKLKRIVEIVFSKVIHKTTYKLLDTEITEYLTLLSSLHPKQIKPNHHFLIHYPRIMMSVGPLLNLSCMRFESKHRDGKVSSHVSICRKNVCRRISIKHQLMLNYRFITQDSNLALFETGSVKIVEMHDLRNIKDFLYLAPQSAADAILSTKWFKYLGHKIKQNSIVTIFSESGPQFYLVQKILISEDNFQIISKKLEDCFFNQHLQAYKIFAETSYSYSILNVKDLASNAFVIN